MPGTSGRRGRGGNTVVSQTPSWTNYKALMAGNPREGTMSSHTLATVTLTRSVERKTKGREGNSFNIPP